MKKGIVGTILSTAAGAVVSAGVVMARMEKSLNEKQNTSNKHFALFKMMNQWVRIKQEGKNLAEYFKENGYEKIAVYGMSYAGETLVYELNDSGITVEYGIDQNAKSLYLAI